MSEDLRLLAGAVRIDSPTGYSLLGEPREVPPPPPETGSGEEAAPPLVRILETDLYIRLYTRFHLYSGLAGTAGGGDPLRLAQRDFVNALSAVNNGTGSWEAGWRLVSVDEDGSAAVIKDEVTFWVRPEGLRARRTAAGEPCRVRVGKELRNLMPGFYVAIGNGGAEPDTHDLEAGPLLRLYWHLTPEAAVPYMTTVTRALNALGVPFRTKVLSDPATYARADAGVLYIERRDFARVRDAVREVHGRIAAALRPEVPMFTRALAPGLGIAEDPGNGLSFGQARCRTAATALWAAFRGGKESDEQRAAALAEAYAHEGLAVDGLHLSPGSRDGYELIPTPSMPLREVVPPPLGGRAAGSGGGQEGGSS